MSTEVPLEYKQMEEQLHRLLGRFFVTFARVELNLSLQVGGSGSFGQKLDRYIDTGARFSENNDEFDKIATWYMAADSLREIRNIFAHGRWGIAQNTQQISHVAGYPPDTQVERRFSLLELNRLVTEAELVETQLPKSLW